MKVYIVTDLEGVSGVVLRDQVFPGNPGYEKARMRLTLEVNAAIEGALEGGAADILVLDGHGANSAYNLVYEELHEGARYIVGSPWGNYLPRLDETYDAIFQIGTHAMAGTPLAVLEHTMSSEAWYEMRINGVPTGEWGLIAAIGGRYGVPCTLVTGDKAACDQAAEALGDIEVAAVKIGLSRTSAEILPPNRAISLIREKAKAAVKRTPEIKPFKVKSPVEIQIQYRKPVETVRDRPGVRRIDRHTVAYTGKDIVEAWANVY